MSIDVQVLDDFSGGLSRRTAAEDFTTRQWSEMEGFVLEDESVLRSQWGLSQVSTDTFARVEYFRTNQGKYLVGIKTDGTVWWMNQPASWELPADLLTKTWNQLTVYTPGAGGADVAITADPNRRAICEVKVPNLTAQSHRAGLLLHSESGTSEALILHDVDGSAVLYAQGYTDFYPSLSGEDADSFKMPHCKGGVMWGDHLVLFGIEWFQDETQPLSGTNVRGYANYLWISEAGKVDTWHPLNVTNIGLPTGAIVSVQPVDAGLLVFVDNSTGWSGVTLLRGYATDFTPEPFRSGSAASAPSTYWPYTGTVVWMDTTGQVWHTDGERVERLDTPALEWPRTTGPKDNLAAWGPWLLVNRNGFVGCLRAFNEDGAWTRLNPDGNEMAQTVATGDQCYFLADDGRLMIFNRRNDVVGLTPRGHVYRPVGGLFPLNATVATPTLSGPDRHAITYWHRFGWRARKGDSGGTSNLASVRLIGGDYQDATAPEQIWNTTLPVEGRWEHVWPAAGPTHDAVVEAVFEGDVEIESFQVWFHRGRGRR